MSSYVNWYIKDNEKENVYAYFDSYSRSSTIYRIFNSVKGENTDKDDKALLVSKTDLQAMAEMAKELINSDKAYLNRIKENCTLILQSNNSMDEKIDYINTYNEHQEEIEEDIETLQYAYYFFEVMKNKQYSGENEYVYAGIEALSPDAEIGTEY